MIDRLIDYIHSPYSLLLAVLSHAAQGDDARGLDALRSELQQLDSELAEAERRGFGHGGKGGST